MRLSFYRSVILSAFLLLALTAEAQQVVKGIVVDSATFSPLPYVSIQVKNKSRGTLTDSQGNFGVIATPEDTLILSLVGYKRVEIPLLDYEASVIRMAEQITTLRTITFQDKSLDEMYDGLFDEQNEALIRKKLPFYYSKAKRDKIKTGRWREENLRVQTYVDVVINNPSTKSDLMRKFSINEKKYYEILTAFNERHYQVMYYLTAGELLSFLNRFFEEYPDR